MTKQRKIDLIAQALLSGVRSGDELAKIQHRFGASILMLRNGTYDGTFWGIETLRTAKGWNYIYHGPAAFYNACSPQCLDCGSFRVAVKDVRMSNKGVKRYKGILR